MAVVSVRELSHETSATLRRVKAGEAVDVTERGTVIARIVPVNQGSSRRAQLIAEGRLRPATGDRKAFLAEFARRVATEPVDHTNAGTRTLLEMRDEERY